MINMLITEWNMEDALAVRFDEGLERGLVQGLERGIETVARNALANDVPMELVQKITGLDMEVIKKMRNGE